MKKTKMKTIVDICCDFLWLLEKTEGQAFILYRSPKICQAPRADRRACPQALPKIPFCSPILTSRRQFYYPLFYHSPPKMSSIFSKKEEHGRLLEKRRPCSFMRSVSAVLIGGRGICQNVEVPQRHRGRRGREGRRGGGRRPEGNRRWRRRGKAGRGEA